MRHVKVGDIITTSLGSSYIYLITRITNNEVFGVVKAEIVSNVWKFYKKSRVEHKIGLDTFNYNFDIRQFLLNELQLEVDNFNKFIITNNLGDEIKCV